MGCNKFVPFSLSAPAFAASFRYDTLIFCGVWPGHGVPCRIKQDTETTSMYFRARHGSGALSPPLRPRGITSALCFAHAHSLLAWASQVREPPLLRLRGIAPALLCTLVPAFVLSLAISIMCLLHECRLLEIVLLFHMRAFV